MANNTVRISGVESGKVYFADSPVVLEVSGLEWPKDSPFDVVRVEVIYNNTIYGTFHAETGGQDSISFNIGLALQAIWSDYAFTDEVARAQETLTGDSRTPILRTPRSYFIKVYTEYLSSDNVFTTTSFGPFSGGACVLGGLTEWERSLVTDGKRDVTIVSGSNRRYGDGSTKPLSSPEHVGKNSITSWTSVGNEGTRCVFYPHEEIPADDTSGAHAPSVLRDDIDYVDFLFRNRRGAVETCSALIKESMSIDVETKTYSRVERPTFNPSRTVMAIASGGRRSWAMSSGYQTREWAEWWSMEFLKARRHWMLYNGAFVPVIVKTSKSSSTIYDKAKQNMQSVEFTATLALEG